MNRKLGPVLLPDTIEALALSAQPFLSRRNSTDEFYRAERMKVLSVFDESDRPLLLYGPSGAGKSTLMEDVCGSVSSSCKCVVIDVDKYGTTLEILKRVLSFYPVENSPVGNVDEAVEKLSSIPVSKLGLHGFTLVAIDRLDRMGSEELSASLEALQSIESGGKSRTRLIGAADFDERLEEGDVSSLGYGGFRKMRVDRYDKERTQAFLKAVLEDAGLNQGFPLSNSELSRLVMLSGGLPQQIVTSCADMLNEKYKSGRSAPAGLAYRYGAADGTVGAEASESTFCVGGSHWKYASRPGVRTLTAGTSAALRRVMELLNSSSEPDNTSAMSELDRARLIAMLETAAKIVEAPVVETIFMGEVRNEAVSIGKAATENQTSAALGQAFEDLREVVERLLEAL